MSTTHPLDLAICPGCGQRWTRHAMTQVRLQKGWWTCACGYEWHVGRGRLPTVRELLSGAYDAEADECIHVNLGAYTRAVAEALNAAGGEQ